MKFTTILTRAFVTLFLTTIPACVSNQDSRDVDGETDDIIAGTSAKAYPEAVLINMIEGGRKVAACSGSLIAPSVVLTAGHCVHTWSAWQVVAPLAGGQSATSTHGATYDWNVTGEAVSPSAHDIGLIFLGAPIQLPAYPLLAQKPLASGAKVLNVGRIHNGQISDSSLYVSKPISVVAGAELGFPYDYGAVNKIEPGDSGGPDVLPGAAPHTIVAVNSGGNASSEVLARVDLVASWIEQQVASHGGGGSAKPGKPSKPTVPNAPATCAHDICVAGTHLDAACSPCVAEVCSVDGFCCATRWDDQCAIEVASVCPSACGAP